MKENIAGENKPADGNAFFIEAAISEGGPRKLKVVPSGDRFLIYDEGHQLGAIEQDEGEWKLVDGELTSGAIQTVGKAIGRIKQ